jgi:hypothetical protein
MRALGGVSGFNAWRRGLHGGDKGVGAGPNAFSRAIADALAMMLPQKLARAVRDEVQKVSRARSVDKS